jgi:hypothetical protein
MALWCAVIAFISWRYTVSVASMTYEQEWIDRIHNECPGVSDTDMLAEKYISGMGIFGGYIGSYLGLIYFNYIKKVKNYHDKAIWIDYRTAWVKFIMVFALYFSICQTVGPIVTLLLQFFDDKYVLQ